MTDNQTTYQRDDAWNAFVSAAMIGPNRNEWMAIDVVMGEHMIPTGYLRIHSYLPGVTIPVLEREWKGSLGMIWGKVQNGN